METSTVRDLAIDKIADELAWSPVLLTVGRQYGIVVTATLEGQMRLRDSRNPDAKKLAAQLCPAREDHRIAAAAPRRRDLRVAVGFLVGLASALILAVSMIRMVFFNRPNAHIDLLAASDFGLILVMMLWSFWPDFRSRVLMHRSSTQRKTIRP